MNLLLEKSIDIQNLQKDWSQCGVLADSITDEIFSNSKFKKNDFKDSFNYVINELLENIYSYSCPDSKNKNVKIQVGRNIQGEHDQVIILFNNYTTKENVERIEHIMNAIDNHELLEQFSYNDKNNFSLGLFNIINRYKGFVFFFSEPFRKNIYKLSTRVLFEAS